MMKHFSLWSFLIFTFLCSSPAFAQDEDQTAQQAKLLQLANAILQDDRQSSAERERLFKLAREEQKSLLEQSEQRIKLAEQKQQALKQRFDNNDEALANLETLLAQRSGALGEVFGVAKESTLELRPMLQDSITNADNLNREDALSFAQSKRVPTIADFETLLSTLIGEMQATGQVNKFQAKVVDLSGQEREQDVLRFGVFSAVNAEGDYLAWDVSQQRLLTLGTQPEHRVLVSGADQDEVISVLIDPSRGELFGLLDRMPSIMERIEQGGKVGYLIIALGLCGLLVALVQIVRLMVTELGVHKQLSDAQQLNRSNPLGRVLLAAGDRDETASMTQEKIEMRIDEAILKELPKIEQGQSFLKLLAAVAPLLGLLGTVVGMIATFQSITLFGTSDPKLMANGISQALMTTVLGLVVAVPVLFCYSLLVARGRRLVQILQEKSLAFIADHGSSHANDDVGSDTGSNKKSVSGNEFHVA